MSWARLTSDRRLRLAIHKRREEARVGALVAKRTLFLSSQGAKDLDRTQVLVSRSEGRSVSQSEAAEHALRRFLKRADLLEGEPGQRRAGAMPPRHDGSKHPRAVPAEVRRALMAEHGDVCAIGLCENEIWLENAHHVPHALGGGNEFADQDRLCSRHHKMKDHGEITWVPAEAGGRSGHYRTREGLILGLKPIAGPGEDPPEKPPDRVQERAPTVRASRPNRSRLRPVRRPCVSGA